MKNLQEECFHYILTEHINERKTEAPIREFGYLVLMANKHQLAPIIYFQTKLPELSSSYYSAVLANTNRNRLTEKILSAFKDEGVDSFLIKGLYIASFYPHPALRTMGDTDIVVSDLGKAHEIMLANGFDVISTYEDREWQYLKNGMEFELHDRLMFDEASNDDKIIEFLSDFVSYVKEGTLDPSFHFIFVLAHLRKHFLNAGVGFRQFLDVAMMMKNCAELDWNWIDEKLNEIGMLPFAKTVFAFIKRWWGVESQIGSVELSDEFYESGTEYIFKNGVFGFDNEENDDFLVANEVRKGGILARLKRIINALFPSYGELKKTDKYAFIKDKTLLLPIAWVYRWFVIIFEGRSKTGMKKLSKAFISNEYVEKREEMFRQWGLAQ